MNLYVAIGALLMFGLLFVVGLFASTPLIALRARWKHKMDTEDIVKIVAACKAPLNVAVTTETHPAKPSRVRRLLALAKRLRMSKQPRDG